MMKPGLPLLMQNLFNQPIALSQRKAEMIVAALAGKLDITQLTAETRTYDRQALAAMAERGVVDARLERAMLARRSAVAEGPMMTDDPFYDRPYRLTANGVAIIEVLGTLTRSWGLNPESGSTGYDGIWTKLAFAMDDPDCKAVWLKINSGGGAVDGLMDIAEAIYRCSARFGGKRIVAYAGDYAYSAAYMIGCAADEFYMPALGGVGSVGAIAIFCDLTRMMSDEGIEAVIFRSAARKAIGIGGMESLDEVEKKHIQEQIDEAGRYFVERVAQYRQLEISVVSETQGWDYTAKKAKAIGFIDAIMSEQDAWAKLGQELAR